MAYCVYADFANSEFSFAATHLGAVVVGAMITRADAEIDTLLRGIRYQTPISGTVPDAIKDLSMIKTGLFMERRIYEKSNSETAGVYLTELQNIINEIENDIKTGKIQFKLPRITLTFDSVGDSLTSPEVSQFNTEIELNTTDIND